MTVFPGGVPPLFPGGVPPLPEVLSQAKRFRVERVTQESPDGTRHAKDIVRHPGAVTIIPLLDDGRICFVENYRVAVEERLVELPAGTLEPPEEPTHAALRELAEETGFRAARIEHLTTLCMSPGILNEKMYVYAATGLVAGEMAWSRPGHSTSVEVQPIR